MERVRNHTILLTLLMRTNHLHLITRQCFRWCDTHLICTLAPTHSEFRASTEPEVAAQVRAEGNGVHVLGGVEVVCGYPDVQLGKPACR